MCYVFFDFYYTLKFIFNLYTYIHSRNNEKLEYINRFFLNYPEST